MEYAVMRNWYVFSLLPFFLMISGELLYFYGLWEANLDYHGKGFYFAVLVLGMFSLVSIRKNLRDIKDNIPTTFIYQCVCIGVLMTAVGLFIVGLWNGQLQDNEKGLYCLAYILSLSGAAFVQKRVRDETP